MRENEDADTRAGVGARAGGPRGRPYFLAACLPRANSCCDYDYATRTSPAAAA